MKEENAKGQLQKGGCVMIYLYTEKQKSDNWILKNNLYFNMYTGNQPLTKEDRDAIAMIDGAKVTEDSHIETKYGLGTILNLSMESFVVLREEDYYVSLQRELVMA